MVQTKDCRGSVRPSCEICEVCEVHKGGLTLKDLKPDTFESNEKSKLSFRQWSDEFSSWVERFDQDFEKMLRLAAQMQEWDKDKFIDEAEQEYRLGAEKVAEFDKHIYLAMKRLKAGIARETVDTSKTAREAWYRLTDRFYGGNVQGATAIASQLQELKRPTQITESFHLLNVIRKLVREFARQSPKEPMPSAIVKADLPQSDGNTSRRRHNLEDKVLAFIRNNTSGAAPMDIGNIAPGLGSSSQSATSFSHGVSDSYPDLNNYEHASQWGQDWNTGDADTSGSSDGELCGLQKGKGKGKSGSFNGICYNCGKSGHSAKFCYAKGGQAKGKGKKGDSKGWNDSKGWTVGKGWSEGKGWNTSGKGWEQHMPAGMNNLERDSKQYDVLVMETSTQEKTVRDGDWCVPVKHVAKLTRMRGQTSTKTNIKFFVDPEEEDRDNDTTSDFLGSKQFALEDDVSYKCSCCDSDGMQWRRKRNLTTMKPSVRFSSLTDADINFFEKGNTDLCGLQQNTWAPLPKPLVVDSGAGETVMPVDWLTSHLLTESDGSRANDFYTTADGSKVYNEGHRKLDVCTLDGQQRRSMTFQVVREKKALGSVSQMVKNGNKLVFDQDSSGRDTSYIQKKRTNDKIWLRQENGVYVLDLMVAPPQRSNGRSTDPHFHRQG